MDKLDSKIDSQSAKTTITIPENIFNAFNNYMVLKNILPSDRGRIVEEALIELFKNNGIPIDTDQGEFVFSIKGLKIKKLNVSISANILKALKVYTAHKGLTQHHQSRIVIVALREFLEKRQISIDEANSSEIVFDIVSSSFIPVSKTKEIQSD